MEYYEPDAKETEGEPANERIWEAMGVDLGYVVGQ